MKVYLDNSVVSATVKGDFPAEEEVLRQLIALFKAGRIDLRISKLVGREIEPYKGKTKSGMEEMYATLNEVPFVEDHELLEFHSQWDRTGGVANPLIEDDPRCRTLRQKGLKRTDAHHLMLAIHPRCHVFLTYDKDFLNRRTEVEREFRDIGLMEPSDLVRLFAESGEGD